MSEIATLQDEDFTSHKESFKIIDNKIKVSGRINIYTNKGFFTVCVDDLDAVRIGE